MCPLKLPDYSPDIKEGEKREIFCLVRKKYVALTPEEWVRQHFLNLLINHLHYPKGMTRLEHSLKYGKQLLKRSDITVLSKSANIFLAVECKSYEHPLDERVTEQLATYNKVLDASYLAITNGLKHFIWKKSTNGFVQIIDFPKYERAN